MLLSVIEHHRRKIRIQSLDSAPPVATTGRQMLGDSAKIRQLRN